jgi:hypothetical protein
LHVRDGFGTQRNINREIGAGRAAVQEVEPPLQPGAVGRAVESLLVELRDESCIIGRADVRLALWGRQESLAVNQEAPVNQRRQPHQRTSG